MRSQGRLAFSLLTLAVVAAACGGGHVALPTLSPAVIGDTTGIVARGEYIVRNAAVCGHCHAADPQKEPDGPLSGGMAFRNWRVGTIRASNLTPDPETGLGQWSDAEIVRALRAGEDRDGDVLAPIMPYEWFHDMSDRDAFAVARYLKSQPPARNPVDNDPNLVYHLARVFFIHVDDDPMHPAPPRAANADYGRYLSNHVALCADCHTPRGGIQSKPDKDRLFAGNAKPPKGFPANPANLTPDSLTGIGKWTEEQFLRTLRSGVNPEGDTLHAFMPWRELSRMTDDDLRAIHRYLKTLPPIRHEIPRRSPGK